MGCYSYPHVCFGWIEPYDKEIDCDTVEDISNKYDIDFRVFCSEMNHAIALDSVYGVLCNFDENTGIASISEEEKSKVIEIYELWKNKNNIEHEYKPSFHLVISGDIDSHSVEIYSFDLNE